jgi:predicted house-cleaning noncanonical NTP pyrophosphatase (MazG superfamily)
VPQRDVLANVNSESAKMYIQYLLMKIKEKFDEFKTNKEMIELSNNIEYIVGDDQLYN